jgi:Holliday junction resolvase
MNRNYVRGVAFERQVMQALLKDDWYAIRSAGSHGAVDVLAWNNQSMKIIQCKTSVHPIVLTHYLDDLRKLHLTPCTSGGKKELWAKNGRNITKILVL